MAILVDNFRWVLLVSGVLTLSMAWAIVSPQAALRQTFGQALEGPVAEVVVRNWAGLICLFALLTIWSAFAPSLRLAVLPVVAAGKAMFIALTLAQPTLRAKAAPVMAVDTVIVVLFVAYLLAARP